MPARSRLKHTQAQMVHSQKARKAPHQDFGAGMGASHSFGVKNKPQGPFGAAALLDEIQSRLVSRGGRPSDPGPTVRRLVPLKKRVWHSLKTQAAYLSNHGRRISPAQLAAILIEKSISGRLKTAVPGISADMTVPDLARINRELDDVWRAKQDSFFTGIGVRPVRTLRSSGAEAS